MKKLMITGLILILQYGTLMAVDVSDSTAGELLADNVTVTQAYTESGEIAQAVPVPDKLCFDNIDLNNKTLALYQNYPNPFHRFTSIEFKVANLQDVRLEVLDSEGNCVMLLLNRQLMPGTYNVEWDAKGLRKGNYFYRLKAGDISLIRRMTIE